MMDARDDELNALHAERIRLLTVNGLLEIEEKYWRKRAEKASYEIVSMLDARATDIAKGQIMICHETADEALRTLNATKGNANSDGTNRISAPRVVAV